MMSISRAPLEWTAGYMYGGDGISVKQKQAHVLGRWMGL